MLVCSCTFSSLGRALLDPTLQGHFLFETVLSSEQGDLNTGRRWRQCELTRTQCFQPQVAGLPLIWVGDFIRVQHLESREVEDPDPWIGKVEEIVVEDGEFKCHVRWMDSLQDLSVA